MYYKIKKGMGNIEHLKLTPEFADDHNNKSKKRLYNHSALLRLVKPADTTSPSFRKRLFRNPKSHSFATLPHSCRTLK